MSDDAKATATGTAKKGIRFSKTTTLVKQQLFTCIILFWTFLCLHYRTTTWKCLISRFVEDVNTRKRLFSFFLRSIQSLRLQLQKTFFQHFMTWTRWNKRDKVWSRANSLFKRRFRSNRRRCCLSSLISAKVRMYSHKTAKVRKGPPKDVFLISSIEVIKLDYSHVLNYIKGSWHEHEKLAYFKLLLLLLWDLRL